MQRFCFLAIHSVMFLFCAFFRAIAQQRHYNISLGSSLSPTGNSSWQSRSGLYAFGFYQQGNGHAVGIFLAGIPEKTVVWTANRDNPRVSSNANLLFSTEGRLVLQSTQGQETDIAGVLSEPASFASMLDSGNFVLHNSNGGIIWQSFDHPTDTILPTQSLVAGQRLFSSISETDHSTGIFRLVMQGDGNLVQYPVNTPDVGRPQYSYWSSDTLGSGESVSLNLDFNGHLFLFNSTGIVKNLTQAYPTGGRIYLMKIDPDGIFRLYSHNLTQSSAWSVVWESTTDRCDPKGVCGVNSFCVLNFQKPDCRCLPGFAFASQVNLFSGCERNFTIETCVNRFGPANYAIQQFKITDWEDLSYSVLSQTTKENCEQACLEDCNCEVAIFKDMECRMQRLPLKFGRSDQNNPNDTAFIKVYNPAPSTDHYVPNEGKKEIRADITIILSCLCFTFLLVILASFGIVYKYHLKSNERIPSNESTVGFCEDIVLLSFRYAEIERMTHGFSEEIGRGSSGTVYKGTMMNGKVVAVKKLRKEVSRGEVEFQTEMKVIGRTHHRNLVRLLGYSCDASNKILVYEYMSNGSLADILFTPDNQPNWVERMGIAYGIARGIRYLHDECESHIIHCDIKPQNVLMDENNRAKISDFGLAKLMKPDQTRTFTGIRGTRGYVAPEWFRNHPAVTVKADVYSFGIVLLEIICRRRCVVESLPEDRIVLQEWAYQCFEAGEVGQLVGDEVVEIIQLERMIKVALWCTLDEPTLRPSMNNILLMFEGKVEIPNPPTPLFFSAQS